MKHREILERLGANKDVGELLGVPPEHVAVWKGRGIPLHQRIIIKDIATFRLPLDFLTKESR